MKMVCPECGTVFEYDFNNTFEDRQVCPGCGSLESEPLEERD